MEVAQVNLPSAADLDHDHPDADEDRLRPRWHQVKSHWKGIGVTLFVNWR